MASEDTELKIGMSPEQVIAALKAMGDQSAKLAATMEEQLGRKGSQAIGDLKDNAEKGSNEITKFFSNMATRIKSDLKTAFDVQAVLAGANFAKQIQEGVKSVFDMERAFDRLGVRLGLTASQMEDFKRSVGKATANAGVNVQDIQGGLMAAASAGIKDPKQLTQVAESLARSRQIDPSIGSGEQVTESIAEILRRQHMQVNGTNYGSTMDAINAATATGNFRSSNDAAGHIAALSQFSSTNGMDTRQLAGLATLSSKGGPAIQALLNQILEGGGRADHGTRINETLHQQVFKNGKLDPQALAKVNPNLYGSSFVLGEASGLQGSNGGDLKVLIETFRDNLGAFNKVVQGTDETATQFGRVSESWAAHVEQFKTRLTNAGRQIGDSFVEFADGIMSGDSKKRVSGAAHLGNALYENGSDLLKGGALSLGASVLMGGGIKGLIGSSAASAAGVSKVYVTNAGEIGGGISGSLGFLKKGPSLGDIRDGGIGGKLGAAAGLLVAGEIGIEIGKVLMEMFPSLKTIAYDATHNDAKTMSDAESAQLDKNRKSFNERNNSNFSLEDYTKAVKDGHLQALKEHAATSKPPTYTVQAAVGGRGGKVGH